jgi:hypothetical protein
MLPETILGIVIVGSLLLNCALLVPIVNLSLERNELRDELRRLGIRL